MSLEQNDLSLKEMIHGIEYFVPLPPHPPPRTSTPGKPAISMADGKIPPRIETNQTILMPAYDKNHTAGDC